MNWLLAVFLVLFALSAARGYRKGLIKSAAAMASALLILALAGWLNPQITAFLQNKTDWEQRLTQTIREALLSQWEEETAAEEETGEETADDLSGLLSAWQEAGADGQAELIESLPLPEKITDVLLLNNTQEGWADTLADDFAGYVAAALAELMMRGAAFVLSYLAAALVMRLILGAADILLELPALGALDHFGGLLLGAALGILWIWIIMLVIMLAGSTDVGAALLGLIRGNPVLSLLYEWNPLISP